jgi:hypothetical protein
LTQRKQKRLRTQAAGDSQRSNRRGEDETEEEEYPQRQERYVERRLNLLTEAQRKEKRLRSQAKLDFRNKNPRGEDETQEDYRLFAVEGVEGVGASLSG